MVVTLSWARAFAYACIVAGFALTLARAFVLDNTLLTSGIILVTAGAVLQILILDFARESYVIGTGDAIRAKPNAAGTARGAQTAYAGSAAGAFVLSQGRAISYTCIVAGLALTLARTFVLDNNLLTSGIILTTAGAVGNILLLDFARKSYTIVDRSEFLLNYETKHLYM